MSQREKLIRHLVAGGRWLVEVTPIAFSVILRQYWRQERPRARREEPFPRASRAGRDARK